MRGVWWFVLVLGLVVGVPVVGAQDPFLPGTPTDRPNDVKLDQKSVAQGNMSVFFEEDSVVEVNRTVDRLHGFNVTNGSVFLRVTTSTSVPGQQVSASFRVSLFQEGELHAECNWVIERPSLDQTSESVTLLCGVDDPSRAEGSPRKLLKSGNISLEFEHSGDAVMFEESTISVHVLMIDSVRPEMHDVLTDSTVGSLSLGAGLWVAVWVALFIWTGKHKLYFASGVALAASIGPFIDGYPLGPDRAVFPIVLWIVAMVLHAMSAWWAPNEDEAERV